MESMPPSHLLCVYAEPLARGRRVLVVGDSTDGVGGRLVELGARLVHVYDPDAERAGRAAPSRGVSVRALYAGDFEARDGAFDLVLIPELSAVRDPVALLARLRRAVGGEGAVLVATRNPEGEGEGEGVDYYDLYEMMALQFASVRMIGQVPFFGAAIAELGDADGAPDVSVYTDLAEEPAAPTAFIALGSHTDRVRLDPYAIVQLPHERVAESASVVKTQELPGLAERAAVVEAAARVASLEAELEERSALARRWQQEAERAAAAASKLQGVLEQVDDRLREQEEDRVRGRQRILELEDALRLAEDGAVLLAQRVADAERIALERGEQVVALAREVDALSVAVVQEQARVAETEARASVVESQRAEAERLVTDAEHRRAEAERLVADAERRRAEAEVHRADAEKHRVDPEEVDRMLLRIAELEGLAASATIEVSRLSDGQAAEIEALEARLRERGQRVAELERELRRQERLGLELVALLESSGGAPGGGEPAPPSEGGGGPGGRENGRGELHDVTDVALREKLDRMALDAARREGELHARSWRISELEQELMRLSAERVDAAPAPRKAHLEDELDMLRRALAQEHEARVQAESGAELAKARAELQRQAVLMEQIARELGARPREARNVGSPDA